MEFHEEDKRAIAERMHDERDVHGNERASEAFLDGIVFAMRCNCMGQDEIDALEGDISGIAEEMRFEEGFEGFMDGFFGGGEGK